jgi:hypothetical protein
MSNSRPVVLGASIVDQTLGDDTFLERLPEFRMLKPKLQAMHVKLHSGRGCRGCGRRRVLRSLFNDYLTVVQSLSPDALARFKKHLGAGQIMFNTHNVSTNKVETKVL